MKELIAKLLLGLINPELVKSIVLIMVEFLIAAVKSSATDWDDKVILPILEKLKKSLA